MSCISDSAADGLLANRFEVEQRDALLAHLQECSNCKNTLLRRLFAIRPPHDHGRPEPEELACTRRETCETREWRSGTSPENLDLQLGQPVDDGEPLHALVEESLLQLGSLASPAERCTRCFQSGLSEIGRLKLQRRLGEGGTSIVYLAYDPVLKRQVALKLPRGPALQNPASRERFLREAQMAALLRHPNIVPIYGAGEVAGIFHITLAYCSGPTLAQWLEQRCREAANNTGPSEQPVGTARTSPPLSPNMAASIVERLANAVDHAYQSGILHRDIKPDNILLEPREAAEGDEFPFTPMLSDFGLAMLADEQDGLTVTGTLVGTPQYMAPEQVTGEHNLLGPATDVYGLGAVLYELLTGQPAVQGRNHAETLMRVTIAEPVLPHRLVPHIPRDLEAICLKCLRKSSAERYQTAAQLADDLRRFQAGEPTIARQMTHASIALRWSRRHPGLTTLVLLLLTAVALLIAAQGAYNLRLDNLNSELSDSLEQTRRAQQLSQHSELQTQQALYASDIRLAKQAWEDLDLRQYHQFLERHRPASKVLDVRGFEWNYLWHLGHVENVTFGTYEGDVYFARYSPDGRWIVTAGDDGIVRFYDAQSRRLEIEVPTGQGEVNSVAFSPDDQSIATAGDDGTVRVWDLQSRDERIRIEAHDDISYQVIFTTDGRLISCGNDPHIRLWNAETGESMGVLQGHDDTVEAIALASDGRHLASASKDETARLWDLLTGEQTRLLHRCDDSINCVAFSQTGDLVALGTKGGEVCVFHANTAELITRLRHLDSVHGVALSPDGRFVAVSDRGGTVGLWRIPSPATEQANEGLSGPVAAWAAHSGRGWSIAFSPNGDSLLSAGSDGDVKLWQTATSLGWRNLTWPSSRQLNSPPRGQRWLAAVPDSAKIVTASGPQGLLLWDLPAARLTSADSEADCDDETGGNVSLSEPFVLDPGDWIVVDASADGRLAAAGNTQGEVALWDIVSHTRLATWSLDPLAAIGGIVLSGDGTRLLAFHSDMIWLIEAGSQDSVQRLEMQDCRVTDFSPDGSRVALGDGNEVLLAGFPDLDRQLILRGHTSTVRGLAFSPDGRLIATSGNDRTIRLWNATSGKQILCLHGHRGAVVDLAFAPNGRSLVATDDVGTLKLWHVATGQELFTLDEISTGYLCVDFLPEGRGLVCGYGRHQVRLLDWGAEE